MTDAATEKFAALLRELKQRSGRSYGSLAARLHVSTSTLHRYCNGDAVPASYAPAERLAHLCGATPDELVELHRRWHRANGTRRGATPSWAAGQEPPAHGGGRSPLGRGSGPAQRGTPATGAGSGGSDGAASAPRDSAARGADAGDVAESAGPGVRDAAGTSGSAGSGDSLDKSASADAPAPAGSGVPASAGTAASQDRRPGAGARGLWRKRRVLLPAAGVAAAALVALVATSSGSTGEGRADGGGVPESAALADGGRGGGAEGAETSEKGGSAEPSERRKPSPAGGGADKNGEPGAAPRKGGATDEDGAEPAARTPLAWSARSHVWETGCDHRYVLDKSPADVPPPPMAQDAEAWAGSQGAVHGGTTNIEALIEPRGDEQVTITAVHVRKTATGTPLPWNAFAMSDGCGGEVTEAAYSADLDVPRPVLKPQQGGDSTQKWDPPALPYRVTPDDPLSLLIYANTEDYDVRWYLEVEWSSGDDSGVVRIDDQGSPFRTSAIKDRPLYGYDTLNGSWRTYPMADDPAPDSASPTP